MGTVAWGNVAKKTIRGGTTCGKAEEEPVESSTDVKNTSSHKQLTVTYLKKNTYDWQAAIGKLQVE